MKNRGGDRDQRDLKRMEDKRLEVLRNSRSRVRREEGKGRAMAVRGGTLEADCRDSQNVGDDKVQGAR